MVLSVEACIRAEMVILSRCWQRRVRRMSQAVAGRPYTQMLTMQHSLLSHVVLVLLKLVPVKDTPIPTSWKTLHPVQILKPYQLAAPTNLERLGP